jgi:hypothetical protein
MKKLTPKQQAQKEARTLTKNKKEAEKLAIKRAKAVRVIKKVIETYKKFYSIISKEKKNIPMKGVSTKALHTLLGTKIKQKAKQCNHCLIKTNNTKTICVACSKIPKCKGCEIILGYWDKEDPNKLKYNNYNRPSDIDPKLCESCYEHRQKND